MAKKPAVWTPDLGWYLLTSNPNVCIRPGRTSGCSGWLVEAIKGGPSYQFPTLAAAKKFAEYCQRTEWPSDNRPLIHILEDLAR